MPATGRKHGLQLSSVDELAYLNALPLAVLAIDRQFNISFVNQAAETLLKIGKKQTSLPQELLFLEELLEKSFTETQTISLYEQPLGMLSVTMHLTPVMTDHVEQVLITIDKADGMHTQAASEWKKETTHAAGVMAAMLAHEVKNPLSGIRGAAQLLKDEVAKEHQPLADLICTETDRIRDLLNQVEVFTAGAPSEIKPVNIHETLQYAMKVAGKSFAQHVKIKELYDPSLPMVMGHRDMLVQLFINLIKNAAEAMESQFDSMLTITTQYRSGYRINNVSLPIMVSIEDNGPGIAPAMRERLFEPFASSKEEGRGLGLAVVAKIATDLGIVVELDKNRPKGARFNVFLAVVPSDK